MEESSVKLHLQQMINEIKNDLSSKEKAVISASLSRLIHLLPEYSLDRRLYQELTLEQKIFFDNYYVLLLNIILNHINPLWDGMWSCEEEKNILDCYFLKGVPYDSLITLCRIISETSLSYKLTKCLALLEIVITSDCIASMILDQCKIQTSQKHSISLCKQQALWEDMISLLVSVPERLANKLQHENRDVFLPEKYGKYLAANILQALSVVYDAIKMEKDCTIEFISHLLGKCCLVGYADVILDYLIPHLLSHTSSDFIWRRICSKLFNGVPDRCLESALTKLIKTIPNPKFMFHLLGDAILKNKKMHLLFTHKFLFIKMFEKDLILQNILFYLAEVDPRKDILWKVFNSLIEVWGDRSAIKHSSYEQHAYITRAILVTAGLLKEENVKEKFPDILGKFTQAVTSHLHSPQPSVRRLGMVTGKLLVKILDPGGPELEFKYDRDDEVNRLEKLVQPLKIDDTSEFSEKTELIKLEHVEKEMKQKEQKAASVTTRPSQQLDSDDDDDGLEAYDMSEDPVKTKAKMPKYLRDCMEGLIESNNPDKTQICLENAELLIMQQKEPVCEVAVDFARILLNMENSFTLPKFLQWREKALVALLIVCPIETSQYLTEQFYSRNYSIRQRIDILDVLSIAAQELSKLPLLKDEKIDQSTISQTVKPTTSMNNWKDIIQQRIESKTKRYGKGPQKKVVLIKNKFGTVAGHFFFPLMTNYDSKDNSFDLLGQDCLVLGRLLYTLGIIMYSAVNTPLSRRMGKSLMDFIWTLRYHTEAYVRRGLLFCFSIVILSLPSHILIEDFQDDLLECRQWVQDSLKDDSDQECQKMAANILQLVSNSIRNEISPDTLKH